MPNSKSSKARSHEYARDYYSAHYKEFYSLTMEDDCFSKFDSEFLEVEMKEPSEEVEDPFDHVHAAKRPRLVSQLWLCDAYFL